MTNFRPRRRSETGRSATNSDGQIGYHKSFNPTASTASTGSLAIVLITVLLNAWPAYAASLAISS
ncbi:hypothetical protein CAter10_1874 [Collimonas arenae]|nr:hypothetical protein CAter10_1874 [Collimonas arenae]